MTCAETSSPYSRAAATAFHRLPVREVSGGLFTVPKSALDTAWEGLVRLPGHKS